MLVIALLNSKGGVGKTTLTCNLAITALRENARTAVLDMDPQHSVAMWLQLRGAQPKGKTDPAPEVFTDAGTAADGIEALSRDGWDVVLIDTPGQFLSHLRDAAKVADFVLLPVKSSVFDLHSIRDAITICEEVGVAYAVVLNDVIDSERFAGEVRAWLESEGVPVLKQQVKHRSVYVSAADTGMAGCEVAGGAPAGKEMVALWAEVKALARAAAKEKVARA